MRSRRGSSSSSAGTKRQPVALDGGAFLKRMGGTGKHIDGNVDEPLAEGLLPLWILALL